MSKKKLFTRLVLLASVVCLAAFAWADGPSLSTPTQQETKTIYVNNSVDLRAGVSDDKSGDIIVISKDAKINMGTTSLSIPAGRTVTLSLDLGSSLDFSNVDETAKIGDYYTGINNLGNLTIAGSGDIVMSKDQKIYLVYCSGNASLDVTGGTLSADSTTSTTYAIRAVGNATVTVTGGTVSAHSSKTVYAIYAKDSANVTVTGGNLSADSSGSGAYAINAQGSANVTVTGGTLSAHSSSSSAYAIDAIASNNGKINVKVTGGTLSADNNSSSLTAYAISAYANDNQANVTVTVTGGNLSAHNSGSTACAIHANTNGSGNTHVTVTGGTFNASAASADNAYAIYVKNANVSADVTSGDFTGKLYSLVNGILRGGTYHTAWTDTYQNYLAAGYEHKTVSENVWKVVHTGSAAPTTSEDLKNALQNASVDTITVSGDLAVSGDTTISGDKTLVVSNESTMTVTNGIIIVPDETSLDVIVYSGTISTDNGPIFEVYPQGKLHIKEGKIHDGKFKYFRAKTEVTPAVTSTPNTENEIGEITIENGTLFYFGDNQNGEVNTFISNYLAKNNQTLVKSETEDGYWEVKSTGGSGSSSSSGCNAGFPTAALALLGLAFIPTRRKRK